MSLLSLESPYRQKNISKTLGSFLFLYPYYHIFSMKTNHGGVLKVIQVHHTVGIYGIKKTVQGLFHQVTFHLAIKMN